MKGDRLIAEILAWTIVISALVGLTHLAGWW